MPKERSSSPLPRIAWFVAGVIVAAVAQASFASKSEDGLAGLLRVGSENPLLEQIEVELGQLHPTDPLGHDGQISYLVARDPFNRLATAGRMRELDQAPYRYRRILYPMLAGGFGLLPGMATLVGLVMWAALGVGLASGAAADITGRLRLPGWVAPLTLLNLGALLSAVLLTADALALGLGVLGLALAGRKRLGWAAALFALAALTKEAYLLFAWAAAAWLWLSGRRRPAAAMAVLPALPLAGWTLWLAFSAGTVAPGLHHIVAPGLGIVEAVPAWLASQPAAVATVLGAGMALLVLASLLISALGGDRLLSLCLAAWAVLGLVLSVNVWEVPTNAMRALAPLWTVGLLALASVLQVRGRNRGASA